MDVILVESRVGRQFVGKQFRAADHVRPDLLLQGLLFAVRNVFDVDLAGLAIQQADDQFLARSALPVIFTAFLSLCIKRASPPMKFHQLRLDCAEFLNAAPLHGFADAMQHEPSGLLGDVQIARDFIATDSVLAIEYQRHGDEPLIKRERTILEDRTDLDRELATVMGLAALPQAARRQETYFLAAADRARDAIGPAQFTEQAERAVRVGKVTDRFHQGMGPCDSFVRAPNLTRRESSRLLPKAGLADFLSDNLLWFIGTISLIVSLVKRGCRPLPRWQKTYVRLAILVMPPSEIWVDILFPRLPHDGLAAVVSYIDRLAEQDELAAAVNGKLHYPWIDLLQILLLLLLFVMQSWGIVVGFAQAWALGRTWRSK